jgi:hypothetical protein
MLAGHNARSATRRAQFRRAASSYRHSRERVSATVIIDFRTEDARVIRMIAVAVVGVAVVLGLLFAVLAVVLA